MIVLLQLIYVTSGLFDIGWLFFGLEQFKLTVARNTLIKISTVVLMFVFVHKPSDLWKYTLIMSAGTLFSQAYLWLYVKKYVSFEKCSVKEITSNIKPVLILFIPVLAYSIYKVMDKIMLGNMSSYDQVGFYNNAEKIINIPMGIITALSDNGGVTRGICKMDEQNNLTEVVETKNIVKTANGAETDGVAVDVNSLVSMNMWGLTPDFLDVLEKGFKEFFEKEVPGNPQKAEYLIPIFIGELLEQGKMSVKVLKTNDTWYGMTYHEDVAAVKGSFKEMLENGMYKVDLFSDL